MGSKSNKANLFHRLLASPFILCLILISQLITGINAFIKYIRYGGELIVYMVDEKPTISKIYQELKHAREQKSN